MLVEEEPRKVGRPPAANNQRELILEKAAGLFAMKGFNGASIADLTEAIQLSKPAIYYYFPTKRSLCDAIILNALSNLVPRTRDNVNRVKDPREQLKVYMTCHANQIAINRNGIITMLSGFDGMTEGESRQLARQLRDEHELFLRKIIKNGIDQGVFIEMDVSMAGRAVLSMLNWMARWYKPDGKLSAQEIAVMYFDILCRGFEARG